MKVIFQRVDFLFILFIFFLLIGSTFYINPIAIWDEAIYANNALEMSHHHKPFILTLDYQPNLYNTKPPLGIWLMAFSIKLFGENEFAVRLPSVLAFLALLIVLIRFSNRQFNSYKPGIFACLVLLGSKGLLFSHGVRSGDLDSLLLLCTTILAIQSFSLLFNENIGQKSLKKEFYKLGGIVITGFFIKSTTIFLLIPGLFICLLLSPNLNRILASRYFYLAPLLLLLVILLYYILMHYMHPGYNRQVLFSEYARVYKDIMPWHRHPFGWYFHNLIYERFTPFIFILLPALLLSIFSADSNIRRVVLFSIIASGTYLLIISMIPDKLEWYDLPAYPFFALIIGIGYYEGMKRLLRFSWMGDKLRIILYCVVIIMLALPALGLRKKIIINDIFHDLEKEAHCIKQMQKKFPGIKDLTVVMEVENPLHRLSLDFYRKARKEKISIKTVTVIRELNKGDTVLCSQQHKLDSLQNYFHVKTLSNLKYGKLLLIQ